MKLRIDTREHTKSSIYNISLTSIQSLGLGCCDEYGQNCCHGDITIRSKAFKSNLMSFLYIDGCVSSIEDGAFESANIEVLSIWQNLQLQMIRRGMFVGVKRIKTLHLEANGIQTIDAGAFSNINGLETIDLSYDKLKTPFFPSFLSY